MKNASPKQVRTIRTHGHRHTCRLMLTALLILLGAGCQMLPEAELPDWQVEERDGAPNVVEVEQIVYWLQTSSAYMKLNPVEAAKRLRRYKGSDDSPHREFRRGLLNQQLANRDGWVKARDIFRALGKNKRLPDELKWLCAIMARYNQVSINANEREGKLSAQLELSRAAELELQQKFKALTSLEQTISNRKELATEDQEQKNGD